ELSLGGCGMAGDYNCDGKVDDADYRLWRNTFGSTKALAADGDGDGTVDAADFTIWRDNANATTNLEGDKQLMQAPEPHASTLCAYGLLTLAASRVIAIHRLNSTRKNLRPIAAQP